MGPNVKRKEKSKAIFNKIMTPNQGLDIQYCYTPATIFDPAPFDNKSEKLGIKNGVSQGRLLFKNNEVNNYDKNEDIVGPLFENKTEIFKNYKCYEQYNYDFGDKGESTAKYKMYFLLNKETLSD